MILLTGNDFQDKRAAAAFPNLNGRGFSFVEFLVSVSLGTLILMAVYNVDTLAKRSFFAGSATMESHAGARSVLNLITSDIRMASEIISTTKVIGGISYNTGDNGIVLKLPALASADGNIVVPTQYDYIGYRIYTLNNLVRIQRGVDAVQADNVSIRKDNTRDITVYLDTATSLKFFKDDTTTFSSLGGNFSSVKKIRVTLTTRKNTWQGKDVKQTLSSIVDLRWGEIL